MDAPFGTVTLVQGPEGLLAERAVQRLRARALEIEPGAAVIRLTAGELDAGGLVEATGGTLFASASVVVIEDLAELPASVADPLLALVEGMPTDLVLVLVHPGGVKGKAVLDRLRKARVELVDAPAVKAWELPQFVMAEARIRGGRLDAAAADFLVAAVGSDLRSLAAAVDQLLQDSSDDVVTETAVRRYFGGRAEVTSFAVADDCLAGNREAALGKLRWALGTGVAPVLLTSALAAGLRNLGKYLGARDARVRDADLARTVGVPPWKLKDLARQARDWTAPGIARAIGDVAEGDAQVKGAAGDAGFALERMVLRVIGRRGREVRRVG